MKKRMIAIAILLTVVFSVSACTKEAATNQPAQPTLVGEWSVQADMTDTVNQMVFMQTGADTVTVSFLVSLELSLQQDGTYSLRIDREQLEKQIDSLGDVLWQFVVDQAAAQSHMTATQAIEALNVQGKNKALLLEQLDLASMFENSISGNGVWKQENNLLYFADTDVALADADGYPITLSDTHLVLTYRDTVETDQESAEKTVTFVKK